MSKNPLTRILFGAFLFLLLLVVPTQTSFASNIWTQLTEGNRAFDQKQYSTAITKYESIIPQFIKDQDYTNVAILYGKLGTSYGFLANYDKAAESWRKEAVYWGKIPNRVQEQIAANRKASFFESEVMVFTEMDGEAASDRYYHHAKFEPVLGAYIGAYAEGDRTIYDPNDPNKFYMDTFPQLTGKKHAAYLLYIKYGLPFSTYNSHVQKAKETGVALQIALEPWGGLGEVQDSSYLRNFAREAGQAGVPIFLRFANEMNDPTNYLWYGDPETYKEKFRLVSTVFKEEAPNVAIVWAPNFFPKENMEQYYPGDAYVDWIGLSMYRIHSPELDPLKQGIDRNSYVKEFDYLYNLYSDRKPVFISEGAVSYTHIHTNADVTNWASREIEDFFAYLPMKYPNVKAFFWFNANDVRQESSIFRHFILSENQTVLQAYRNAIKNPFYLSNIGDASPVFYGDVAQYGIAPRNQTLHAFVKAPVPNISKVVYKLNGHVIGQATKAPWTISYNFASYPGQQVNMAIEAYSNETKVISRSITAQVGNANVLLNGKYIDFDAQPIIVNNRTYIPIRQLAEAMNAEITWNGAAKSFTIKKGNNTSTLTINSSVAFMNGQQVHLETAPFIQNNRSYLPLRVIAEEVLNLDVQWDPSTYTVSFKNN